MGGLYTITTVWYLLLILVSSLLMVPYFSKPAFPTSAVVLLLRSEQDTQTAVIGMACHGHSVFFLFIGGIYASAIAVV